MDRYYGVYSGIIAGVAMFGGGFRRRFNILFLARGSMRAVRWGITRSSPRSLLILPCLVECALCPLATTSSLSSLSYSVG